MSPGEVSDILARWTATREQFDAATSGMHQARLRADEAKRGMAAAEADVIANGGYGEVVIDGRNEATRSAQLAVALERHGGYQAMAKERRTAEQALAHFDAALSSAEQAMRQYRAALDWATALMLREAYALGAERKR